METESPAGRLADRAGAGGPPPRRRSLGFRLMIGVAVPALAVLLILLILFSRSLHLGHGLSLTIAFTLVSALALAGTAFAASVALSRPEGSLGVTFVWLPALIILAAGVAAELAFVPRQKWFVRMASDHAFACFAGIFVLSLPLLAGALWALRAGAPRHPQAAGAAAGLLAGGVTAALYLVHCPEDSLLFTLAWHVPALMLVAALGATLGDRVLRR
jgi:hypothetical protein